MVLAKNMLTAAQKPKAPPPSPAVYEPPSFSRFSPTSDLVKYGQWLSDRLRKIWPHMSERLALSWMRGCAESNEFLFIKSAHAVSLFERARKALDARPTIEEVFVFADDTGLAIREAAAHYAEARRWGKGYEAVDMIVGAHSDVPREMIEEQIGKLVSRHILCAAL